MSLRIILNLFRPSFGGNYCFINRWRNFVWTYWRVNRDRVFLSELEDTCRFGISHSLVMALEFLREGY